MASVALAIRAGRLGTSRHGGRACAVVLGLLFASAAFALPVVYDTPTGSYVQQSGPSFSVPAGQPIDWHVSVCNDTGADLQAQVFSDVHGIDCPNNQYLILSCPPIQSAGGVIMACDDASNGTVDVEQILIPDTQCADVTYRTLTDLLTPPGTQVCNEAFYHTDVDSNQTRPPGSATFGCTCVTVTAPLPPTLDFSLWAAPATPPFISGDSTSVATFHVDVTNRSPRVVPGVITVPIPTGLVFEATTLCPAGVTCAENPPGTFEISGLSLLEGASVSAEFTARATCASAGMSAGCTQAQFAPEEAPSSPIPSDGDSTQPGAQQTCLEMSAEDLAGTTLTYAFDDRDGNGIPSAGDQVDFQIHVWNRGFAAARDVQVQDFLPRNGYDRSSASVDSLGSYDPATGKAIWNLADVGPGSSVTLHLRALLTLSSAACDRATIRTALSQSCGLPDVSSDDPSTSLQGDATCIAFDGTPALVLTKSLDYVDTDGDGRLDPGELATFTIVATNRGGGPLTGATLRDDLDPCWAGVVPGSVTIDPPGDGTDASGSRSVNVQNVGGTGGLAAGSTVTVTFRTTPSSLSGDCCNQATLTGGGGSITGRTDDPRTPGVWQDPTCVAPTVVPVMRLTKSVSLIETNGNGQAEIGERFEYSLLAHNQGGLALQGGLIADELPRGVVLDPRTVVVSPVDTFWVAIPAPLGVNGAGRLEIRDLNVAPGGMVTARFQGVLDADAVGTTCNQATLIAPGFKEALLSDDAVVGGPTCRDVVLIQRPVLFTSVAPSGALFTGCALPGEDGDLDVSYQVSGAAGATGCSLALGLSPNLAVLDAGGGGVGPSGVTWNLGDLPLGASGTMTVHVQTDCSDPVGDALIVSSAFASPDANSGATAGPLTWTTAEPVVQAPISATLADQDGNGTWGTTESVTATADLQELAGCEADGVGVTLSFDPALIAVATVQGGGVLGSGTVTWTVPVVPASGHVPLIVELVQASGAAPCGQPSLSVTVGWPTSPGTACTSTGSWLSPTVNTPALDCQPPLDLLREVRVTSLTPVTPALGSLLNAAGSDDSCSGLPTRIDPTQVYAADVGALLTAGVVVANDAIPVSAGQPGVLIFYEVSESCDTIHACKVDADSNPLNGLESVRIGTAPCVP